MQNKITKSFFLLLLSILFTACSGFFEKDNTPAPAPLTTYPFAFQPKQLWRAYIGESSDDYLKMNPAVGNSTIFTASTNGTVTAINKNSGTIKWQTDTQTHLTTGPGLGDGLIVTGSPYGEITALQESNGHIAWKTKIPGEILAKPAVNNGIVIVKTTDGYVRALSARNGEELWSVQQAEPNLILRGSSSPLIRDQHVILGFANGNLSKLTLNDGQLIWTQKVATPEGAFTIQRMIDIDADPILYDHRLYAATYQGRIASLDWTTGNILWAHDISTYTGMTAANDALYISDAKSHIWAFNANNGQVLWRQLKLEARGTTAPAVMHHYVVVGDAEGYLHWLNKNDGSFAAREYVGGTIYSTPIVDNNVLYVLNNKGYLIAYTL